jgi:hypothetical protein
MNGSARTPTHLWIVGVLSLLWNAVGAYNYIITHMRSEAYLAATTEAQRAYFDSLPVWTVGAWALGVWGAVLGSLLLLARSRFAVHAFGVSLAGLVVANIYYRIMAPMPGEESGAEMGLQVAIWVIAIALLVYALRMQKSGVLR